MLLFALAAAGGLLYLRRAWPPERIKAFALEKLEAALGRQVRIETASLGLRGATLSGLEVSEVPDFKAGTMLKAGSLRVSVDLKPLLLERRASIGQVALSDWRVNVRRSKDGKLNVSSGEPSSSAGGGGGAAVPLTAALVSASGGTVDFDDRASGSRLRLSGIETRVEDFRLDAPVPFKVSFAFSRKAGGAELSGRASLKGRIDLAKSALTLDPSEASLGGLALKVKGSVSDFEAPKAALEWDLSDFSAKDLAGIAELPAGLAVPASKGRLKLSMKGDKVSLSSLRLEAGPFKADASGTADLSGKEAALDLKVKAPEFSLEEAAAFSPEAKALGLKGRASLDLKVVGPASAPALSGKAELKGLSGVIQGQKLSGLDGSAVFTPEKADASLAGRMNEGPLKFSAHLTGYRGKTPALRVDGDIPTVDLGAMPKAEKAPAGKGGSPAGAGSKPAAGGPMLKTSGKVSVAGFRHPNLQAGRTDIVWDLTGLAEDLSKLNGKLDFNVGSGKFDDLKDLVAGNKAAKLVLFPIVALQKVAGLVKVPLFPAFDRVNYKEIVGKYSFANGTMKVQESHLDSSAAYVDIAGGADLARDQLDLKVSARIGGKANAPVIFRATGSLNNPSVRLDAAATLLNNKEGQRAVEKGLEQGQKLLQDLFKKR